MKFSYYEIITLIYQIFNVSLFSSQVKGATKAELGNGVTPVQSHACERVCKAGVSMMCNYTFEIDNYYSMSKACFNCPLNVTDCYRPTCITGNGVQRLLYTVNVAMPGPTIAVCEGDTINVLVTNRLGGPTTSIHWHGIFQKGTAYMDGVPFVTQCPINPYSQYQYKFPVHQAGSYFWHSHSAYQIIDGLAGMLIVRQPPKVDPNFNQYNVDLNEHAFIFGDWPNTTGFPLDIFHYHAFNNLTYTPPIIVNGRGQQAYFRKANGANVYTPLAQFNVDPGTKNLFRMCNNVNSECPTIFTIDGHTLTVIATDGNPVKPYEVDAIVTGQAQRIDFVLNANYSSGNFLMRFQGYGKFDFCKITFGAANLHYKGSIQTDLTALYTPGNLNIPENRILYELNNLTSLTPTDKNLGKTPGSTLYFGVGTIPNNDPLFYNPIYYPWSDFDAYYQLPLNAINGISMSYPPSPLLTQFNQIPKEMLCNQKTFQGVKNCSKEPCSCVHVEKVKLGDLVEIVMLNTVGDSGYHTFHLHGYAFAVVAQGTLPAGSDSIAAFKRLDSKKLIKRNFKAPPLMDSIPIPFGGYSIIRFVADNPGFWMFHCHMTFHFETGMGMVIQVGEPSQFGKFPPNLPKCGNFLLK